MCCGVCGDRVVKPAQVERVLSGLTGNKLLAHFEGADSLQSLLYSNEVAWNSFICYLHLIFFLFETQMCCFY